MAYGLRVSQMNGKPLIFLICCDFGQPGRRTELGRHTSLPIALRLIFRDTTATSGYEGQLWVEDTAGRRAAGPFDKAHRPSVAARA